MEEKFRFERLEVWQRAKELVLITYQLTRKFPREEAFGLSAQVRRASVSIMSNLAEGTGRATPKDQAHFSGMAFASLMETMNQIILAKDLTYIDSNDYSVLRQKATALSKMISSLRRSQLEEKRGTLDERRETRDEGL